MYKRNLNALFTFDLNILKQIIYFIMCIFFKKILGERFRHYAINSVYLNMMLMEHSQNGLYIFFDKIYKYT